MAEAVQIPFDGENQGLKQSLIEIRDLFVQVRDAHKTAQQNVQQGAAESVAQQEKLNGALTSTVAVIAQLDKQARSAGTGKIAEDLDKATVAADKFGKTATTAAEGTADALLQVERNSKRATQANEQGARNLTVMRQRAQELLGSIRSIPPEQRQMLTEIIKSSKSYEQLRDIAKQLAVEQAGVNTQVKSLRAQMLEARNEAALARQQFGEFSPEFQLATQRAGELQNAIQNIDKRITALNPGQKFAAIGQLAQSIAGGFTAIQGVLGLIGTESEDVQRALLKVQSALAITQGLNAFFGGFTDGLKNVRALLVGVTKAQVASTLATRADVGAKIADAAATGAVATATTGATFSIRAFTAALVVNPIFLAVAALGALVAAFSVITIGSNEAAESVQDFIDRLDEVEKRRKDKAALEERIAGIKDEITVLDQGTEAAKARTAAQLDEARTIDKINKDIAAALRTQNDAIAERTRRMEAARKAAVDAAAAGVGGGSLATGTAGIEALKAEQAEARKEAERTFNFRKSLSEEERAEMDLLDERVKQSVDEQTRLQAELTLAQEQATNEQIKIDRQAAEDRIRIREQLVKELAALETELARRAFDADVQQADPEEKLRLEKRNAERSLQILEDQIREANRKLTGKAEFDKEQEEQLARIRLAINQKFEDDLTALRLDNAKARIELIAKANERERAEFEAALRERVQALRVAGAEEQELVEFQARERLAFAETQVAATRAIAERIALAEVEEIVEGGKLSEEAERQKQIRILELRLRFAELALVQINADGSDEATARIAEAKALIVSLQNQIAALRAGAGNTVVDLFDLLGLKFSPEGKAAVVKGINEVMGLITTMQLIATSEVQQQISATDQIIADRERRLDDLHSRLDEELRLNEQGFASNVKLIQDKIAAEEEAAAADKARRKSLLEEQKKIARQQLTIDAIVQASQLATAAARVFGSEAIKGIPGIIGAIGFLATMLATFISFKARAKAIANEGAQFYEGTTYVDRERKHRPGRDTVPAHLTRGEAVIPVKPNRRFAPLVEGIVENDIAKVQQAALEELLEGTNVRLNTEATQLFIDQKREVHQETTINQNVSTKALERKVAQTTDEIRALREDLDSVEVRQEDRGRVERGRNYTNLVRR